MLFAARRSPFSQAQSTLSDASALSALPVAISVAAPVMILSAGAVLTVVAVEATSTGAVGARTRIRWRAGERPDGLAGRGGASTAVGTAVVVTAIGTGWVLSAASQAIAFIPNEIGAALLYNERVTR